ncbi:unnamed protein product [Aphanomyces euteiches]|uniref:Uncharacterized protein n=1 Tax=Aphanomyces euteiches TaxID=100861 RepID=A0A6G0WUK7_9STRA|nr:hypothetical protein Ae201684_011479 [Aphanomyces euteiches]KAH9132002.1 hypothetical protein AeRB84_021475 [Aphanomyces euteiches]
MALWFGTKRRKLESMTEYEYADLDEQKPAPPVLMTLEDTAQKVKRLQAEGNTLAEAGRFRAAIERWQQGLTFDPNDGVLCELIAQAHMATDEYFLGIQAATRATELCPTWGDAYATLAHCQFNFGELELAYASLSKALDLETDSMRRQEIADELKEIETLCERQREKLAQASKVHFDDADAAQVHECKTNLARRSIAWS